MKKNLLFIIVIITFHSSFGQVSDCLRPKAFDIQNVNQYPITITNYSANFNENVSLLVSYPSHPSTIYFSNLWIAGKGNNGTIKMAGSYYYDLDFFAGPLDTNWRENIGVLGNNFDKIWSVSRYDIELHIADYQDNNKIDKPNIAIFGWPAKGNTFFKNYNGFHMPNRDLAPFADKNKNGVYEPDLGEFPLPEGVDQNTIPELITWTIFNDRGGYMSDCYRGLSKEKALPIEIKQTTWGFDCPSSNMLNHTNFVSYRVNYQGLEDLDSTAMGFFTDFDLGCYTDDFFGCTPNQNTYFAYNRDEVDGNAGFCEGGVRTWKKEEMPVVAVTLLNQKMSSFMVYNRQLVGQNIPIQASDPSTSLDFYRYMNGQFKDGSPFSKKGWGYNPKETLPTSNFAFDGNPNDSIQFSMRSINVPENQKYDSRCVGSIQLGKLKRGQEVKIDLAYSTHNKKNNSVSENIDLMYQALDSLQNIYNQGFKNICLPKKYCEGNNCIYPGDVNKDGIVNYKDVVFAGSVVTKSGTERTSPLVFAPVNASDWGINFPNGMDIKSADVNGNGYISSYDVYTIKSFYDRVTPSYKQEPDTYAIQGNDVELALINSSATPIDTKNLKKGNNYQLSININSNDIQSIGFQIEIDTNFIALDSSITQFDQISKFTNSGIYKFRRDKNMIIIDIAASSWSNTKSIQAAKSIYRSVNFFGRELIDSFCTSIRIKNIVAFRKDGTIMDITAKDLDLCFTNLTSTNEIQRAENPIEIAPNPFENELFIKNKSMEAIDIQLFNMIGQSVANQKLNAVSDLFINTDTLPNGVYILQCSNKEQYWITKVIKK